MPITIVAPKLLNGIRKTFRIRMVINGLAILPFIFVRTHEGKNDPVLINHERIHLRQQIELLFIGFIFWYYIAMFRKGYRGISFEREAYANQDNLNYLKERKLFAFYRFIKKN